MRGRDRYGWLAAMAALLAVCTWLAWTQQAEVEPAEPVFAAVEEDLFAIPAREEERNGFSIEVISVGTPKPPKRVLIYHTHTYEAFEQQKDQPYQETEKWRTADNAHNVVRVGEELAALLRSLGVEVVHDTTAFEPPVLSSAYARSLDMLNARHAAGERYDLYIDLHRDAYIESQKGPNTVRTAGGEAARLMLLIGKGEGQTGQGFGERPDWEKNMAYAEKITDSLNEQAEGLCRDVCVKSGRYNQHVAGCCILIEAGNNRNTLAQVLTSMPYLADAVAQVLGM